MEKMLFGIKKFQSEGSVSTDYDFKAKLAD